MQFVEPAIESRNPCEKKAGFLVMGIICQGCESYVKSKLLKGLLDIMKKGILDPSPVARNAALFTMGQMGEHLQVSLYSDSTNQC